MMVPRLDSHTAGEKAGRDQEGVSRQANDQRQAGFQDQNGENNPQGIVGVERCGDADEAHCPIIDKFGYLFICISP